MNKLKLTYQTYMRIIPMFLVAITVLGSYWYLREHPTADEVIVLSVAFSFCLPVTIVAAMIIGRKAKRDQQNRQ